MHKEVSMDTTVLFTAGLFSDMREEPWTLKMMSTIQAFLNVEKEILLMV